MSKPKMSAKRSQKSKGEALFFRADKMRDRRALRPAFRLFLAGEHAGHKGSKVNTGYCYDTGCGTRRDRLAARSGALKLVTGRIEEPLQTS